MEDILKFSHSFRISRDTRKLILDMIRSMQSVFPARPFLINREIGLNDEAVVDHVTEILEMAREKPEIFDGIINPDELEKYIKAASDFGEIGDKVEKLLNTVRDYQQLASYLTCSMAMMIKDHLEMIHPEDCKELNKKMAGSRRPAPFSFTHIKTNLKVV